jgi:hypothetical protein
MVVSLFHDVEIQIVIAKSNFLVELLASGGEQYCSLPALQSRVQCGTSSS